MGKISEYIDLICREPYRIFFPLGVLMGIVGVSPWLLYAFGLSKTYSGYFHSSMQMLVYMNCFVAGFLMTFIPRFTGTFYASKAEVLSFLFLFMGMVIFLRSQAWAIVNILYLLWIGLLIIFVFRRAINRKKAGGQPPLELVWIPIAIVFAVSGNILSLLIHGGIVPRGMAQIARALTEQGFLSAVVIGIGGFLVPRLLGTYRNQPAVSKECCSHGACSMSKKTLSVRNALLFHAVCGLLLFISFWLRSDRLESVGYFLKAIVITAQFLRARVLLGFPRDVGFYAKLAWLSCWMVVLGFWGAFFFPNHDIEMLHITFIGGFTLMTFAVATMVIFSHNGEAEELKKSLWVLWVILVALAISLTHRLLVIWYPLPYFRILGIASSIWAITALVWVIYILPKLVYISRDDEFQKMHDQAKGGRL